MQILGDELSHKLLGRMLVRLAGQYRASGLDEVEIKARCRMEIAAFMGLSTWEDLLETMPPKPLKSLKFSHSEATFNQKTIARLVKFAQRCNARTIRVSNKNGIQVNREGWSGSSWDNVEARSVADHDVSALIKHISGCDASLLGRGTYWIMHEGGLFRDYKNLRCKVEVNENNFPVLSICLSERSNRKQDFVGTLPKETISHQQGVVIVSHAYRWEETILAICSRRQKEISSPADTLVHFPEEEPVSWPNDPCSLMQNPRLRDFSLYESDDLGKTMTLPPHILVLKPWPSGDELANAMEAQKRGYPVYLGVSGEDFRFTHKIERVADALLNIFEGLPEQSWKEKAQELVENLHSVVAVCNTHNYVESIETLVLTPPLRTQLTDQIALSAKPDDVYPFIAKMVVSSGTSISSNAMIQEELGILKTNDRDWLLAVDEKWRQQYS